MSKNVADLRSAVAVHKLLKETEDHWTGVIPYTWRPFEDITCQRDKIPHAREWLSGATINAVAGLELSSKYGLPMANRTEWVLSADLKDRLGKKYHNISVSSKDLPNPEDVWDFLGLSRGPENSLPWTKVDGKRKLTEDAAQSLKSYMANLVKKTEAYEASQAQKSNATVVPVAGSSVIPLVVEDDKVCVASSDGPDSPITPFATQFDYEYGIEEERDPLIGGSGSSSNEGSDGYNDESEGVRSAWDVSDGSDWGDNVVRKWGGGTEPDQHDVR